MFLTYKLVSSKGGLVDGWLVGRFGGNFVSYNFPGHMEAMVFMLHISSHVAILFYGSFSFNFFL